MRTRRTTTQRTRRTPSAGWCGSRGPSVTAACLSVLWGAALAACNAPISTTPSPAHPRIVQLRNSTADVWELHIVPAPGQPLPASITFSGALRPGQVKHLYLYHGYTYEFRLDPAGDGRRLRQRIHIGADLPLVFAGDSLATDANPIVTVGTPVMIGVDAREQLRERRGPPDQILRRMLEGGSDEPYEVWIYRTTGYRYVFLDEHRNGHYILLTTTDPEEQGRGDWRSRLSPEAVDEIEREF